MLVLFENGTPRTLALYLIDYHTVTEARAREGGTSWETETFWMRPKLLDSMFF